MSLARAGHGASIQIELDPVGSPGTFTEVAELNGDITAPGLNRPAAEVTPHQDDIDSHVIGRLGRETLSFSVNFLYDNNTHDHLTGLQKKIIDNEFFGVRVLGPNGSASTDEIIASGHCIMVSRTYPVREGAITAEVQIQLSKAQIIDGVTVGTAA